MYNLFLSCFVCWCGILCETLSICFLVLIPSSITAFYFANQPQTEEEEEAAAKTEPWTNICSLWGG